MRPARVHWQLNLKDDETNKHADAFIYDDMLKYAEKAGEDKKDMPVLK